MLDMFVPSVSVTLSAESWRMYPAGTAAGSRDVVKIALEDEIT